MQYQLYIDSFLFLNLMLNCFVLMLMEQLADCRLQWRWRIGGAILGAVTSSIFLLLPGLFGAGRVLSGQLGTGWILTRLVMTKSGKSKAGDVRRDESHNKMRDESQIKSDGTKKHPTFAQMYLYFWFSTFLLGGILVAMRNLLFLLTGNAFGALGELLAGGIIVSMLSGGIKRYRRGRRQSIFQVELWQEGRSVTLMGLLDSGNSLAEPLFGAPVCLVDEKVFTKFLPEQYQKEHPERFRVVPFHSVGKAHGLLNGFLVEKVVVHRRGEDICREDIVLAKIPGSAALEERYQMILNRCFVQ